MVLLRKRHAGTTSLGYQWNKNGEVVEVRDDHAAELLAIPDGGFSVADDVDEPTPPDPLVDVAALEQVVQAYRDGQRAAAVVAGVHPGQLAAGATKHVDGGDADPVAVIIPQEGSAVPVLPVQPQEVVDDEPVGDGGAEGEGADTAPDTTPDTTPAAVDAAVSAVAVDEAPAKKTAARTSRGSRAKTSGS